MIQSLKSSCIVVFKVLPSGTIIVSISSINLRPKWQFYRITHPPSLALSSIAFLANLSYPSPIETFSVGNFFFFLANSSMLEVGSAPADKRNKTGSICVDSSRILSIGYDKGSVNAFPSI